MPRYIVSVNGREFDIDLEYRAGEMTATVDGKKRKIVVHNLGDTRSLLLVDDESYEVDVRNNNDHERIAFIRGVEIPVAVEDYNLSRMRKTAGISGPGSVEKQFKAPMPGLIVDIKVEIGQKVKAGNPLVVIEAMKMENILKAKGEGTVKAISIKPGQSVEKGEKLVEFE